MNRRDIFKLFGGAAGLPVVKSIEALELKKGDALVVETEQPISQENADRLKELLQEKFPDRVILVHGPDVKLKVLRSA